MFTTTVDLTLKSLGDSLDKDGNIEETERVVKVTLQQISPFVLSTAISKCTVNGTIDMGAFVQEMVGKAIIMPKNICEQLQDENTSNGFEAMAKLFNELNGFCSQPKRYILLQKQSEATKNDVGDSPAEPNVNGDETTKQ